MTATGTSSSKELPAEGVILFSLEEGTWTNVVLFSSGIVIPVSVIVLSLSVWPKTNQGAAFSGIEVLEQL